MALHQTAFVEIGPMRIVKTCVFNNSIHSLADLFASNTSLQKRFLCKNLRTSCCRGQHHCCLAFNNMVLRLTNVAKKKRMPFVARRLPGKRRNLCGILLFESYFCNIFATVPRVGGKIFHFCCVFLQNSVLQSRFWLAESKIFFILVFSLCLASFWGGLWFIHFGATGRNNGYLGLWNCSSFPHGQQMWSSGTLGLQSIAQTSTNKQVFRMIQAYQFFNKPVPSSSILMPTAHEMPKHQWNLQHGPTTFSQNWFVKSYR